jgi:hypothetical protein
MLRKAITFLAIVLVLGSPGLCTSAFAGGGGHGGSSASDGLRGTFGGNPGDGFGGYSHRASGLRGGFHGNGSRDVWGHWGAYYGPMVPMI